HLALAALAAQCLGVTRDVPQTERGETQRLRARPNAVQSLQLAAGKEVREVGLADTAGTVREVAFRRERVAGVNDREARPVVAHAERENDGQAGCLAGRAYPEEAVERLCGRVLVRVRPDEVPRKLHVSHRRRLGERPLAYRRRRREQQARRIVVETVLRPA